MYLEKIGLFVLIGLVGFMALSYIIKHYIRNKK